LFAANGCVSIAALTPSEDPKDFAGWAFAAPISFTLSKMARRG
jgi:hypothetical protein